MKLEVGKTYVTRGGWDALVVWKTHDYEEKDGDYFISASWFYAVHKPRTKDESIPVCHNEFGKAQSVLSVNEPPNYNNEHPADIIKEKKK